ncbi:MAG: diaminopimelate epimerase, partial [Limisphaerales bacterium]
KEAGSFITSDGIHHAEFTEGGDVKLEMANISVIKKDGGDWVLDTGSPHYVSFRTRIKALDVLKEGMSIRHNTTYNKEGINVNFVEEENQGLFVRTFERGVEAETLACGTGVTACAIAFAHKKGFHGHTEIDTRAMGGNLSVAFYADHGHFSKVHLIGPAEKVFSGEIDIAKLMHQYNLRKIISEKQDTKSL